MFGMRVGFFDRGSNALCRSCREAGWEETLLLVVAILFRLAVAHWAETRRVGGMYWRTPVTNHTHVRKFS